MKRILIIILSISLFYGCDKGNSEINFLNVSLQATQFTDINQTVNILIDTDAASWNIENNANWLTLSGTSGTTNNAVIRARLAYRSSTEKQAELVITAGNAEPVTVSLSQTAFQSIYPNYNTTPIAPDNTGMSSTAQDIADRIKLGINIGNTLEATGGETVWGNPLITEELIARYKELGFDMLRLPASFDQYADQSNGEIPQAWLDRVKTVVQYCINQDMPVILNIHWDQGWLTTNVGSHTFEIINSKQRAYWQQIATHLRAFDERLIFASANEPAAEDEFEMSVLLSYHQAFIDAVRSTGGKNSHRVLVFQGPGTNIQLTKELMTILPEDELPGKLMAEVHYYHPYQFTLMEEDASWGNIFYYWGEANQSTINTDRNANFGGEDEMEQEFEIAGTQFAQKGIPVILGEYGAYKRPNIPEQALHDKSVEDYVKYATEASLRKGLLPFYWDTGGLIDRNTYEVKDQAVLDALLEGAGK